MGLGRPARGTLVSTVPTENRFYGKPKEDPLAHLKKFDERCNMLKLNHPNVRLKLFPYSSGGKALDWILRWHLVTLASGLI